jgi:hypothetical protein
MNVKQLGLEAVLIGFLGLNAYVIYQYGYIGFLEQALTNTATVAVFVDLTIALSLVLLWLWQDARERGVSVLPYIVLTFVLGSVGPLLYLIRRFGKEPTLITSPQTARL